MDAIPSAAATVRASWAPYLASMFGLAVLIVALDNQPFFPVLSVCAMAVALAMLVSARQYLAQRDLVRTQRALAHQSLHDPLTGLPNRSLVSDRPEQMLARARRHRLQVGLLYVDLDGFKAVNDGFGHPAGDELLCIAAGRMVSALREGDTVARMGGDEFVVLIDSITWEGCELAAQRLLGLIREPVTLSAAPEATFRVTASIGIALGDVGATFDELLRTADHAMYAAKGAGKDRYMSLERAPAAVSDGQRAVGAGEREHDGAHARTLVAAPNAR